jgi:hypothetical protein
VVSTEETTTPIIWMMGDSVDLCEEFSRQSGHQYYPNVQFDDQVTFEYIRLHQASNYWACSDTNILAKSVMLKYFKSDWTYDRLTGAKGITQLGMIILVDSDDILSIKLGIDAVKYIENHIPYTIAIKSSGEFKSWHNTINVLTDESTLTYNLSDKDSIKQVWLEMIGRFELDCALEKRFLGSLESKV